MPELHSIVILGEAHREIRIIARTNGDLEEPVPNLLKSAVPRDGRLEIMLHSGYWAICAEGGETTPLKLAPPAGKHEVALKPVN